MRNIPRSQSPVRSHRAARSGVALASSWPFGGYLWARALAYLGFWSFALVSATVMFERTRSVSIVGLLTVAQFIPQFALTPLSGSIADRGHVATQIVLGFVLTGFGCGLLGGWILAVGSVSALPGAWPVLLASFIVGIGFAVGSASTAAVLPALVGPGELGTAVALNSVPLMLARAVGPAAGGVVAWWLGPAWACLMAAALNLGCGVLLAVMRLPRSLGEVVDDNTTVRRAVRHVWRDRRLLMVLVGVATVGFGAEPAVTLAPAIAARIDAPDHAGWIASAFGIGGVIGLTMLGALRRRVVNESAAVIGLGLMGLGLAIVGVRLGSAAVLAGMAVAGIGMTVAHANLATLVQVMSPDLIRGRVTALWFLCWLGTRPLSATVSGSLADLVGTTWALLVAAAIVLCGGFACHGVWSRRELPAPLVQLS